MSSKVFLPSYQSSLLSSKKIIHHFFTRQGGFSNGIFSSLNTSFNKGDSDNHVTSNRKIIKETIENECLDSKNNHYLENNSSLYLVWMQQSHSNQVHYVEDNINSIIQADTLVTKTKYKALCIQTADCVPILLHDAQNDCIAAIHAGWKGALTGIIQKTIKTMISKGSKLSCISAVVGPCIHQNSYQVNHSFYKTFTAEDKKNKQFFKKDPQKRDHFLFDLPCFCKTLLHGEGIDSVDQIPLNTYKHEDLFFSCRRALHKKESSFGNQASMIMLI